MCRKFAAELTKRTNGALTAEDYPNSALVKTVAQYSAIGRGALDLTKQIFDSLAKEEQAAIR